MRYSSSEKLEIILIIEDSELSVRQTLNELSIHRSKFHNWYRSYLEDGVEGLGPRKPKARTFWNNKSQGSWTITTIFDTKKLPTTSRQPMFILDAIVKS